MSNFDYEENFEGWYSFLEGIAERIGVSVADKDAWKEDFDLEISPEDSLTKEYPDEMKSLFNSETIKEKEPSEKEYIINEYYQGMLHGKFFQFNKRKHHISVKGSEKSICNTTNTFTAFGIEEYCEYADTDIDDLSSLINTSDDRGNVFCQKCLKKYNKIMGTNFKSDNVR